ncbi:MAG: type II secretion system protein [bacterium]
MKKGFTLVELLITMSLVAVISLIISNVFISGYRTFNDEISNARIQANSQTILDKIITETKNGMLIEASHNGFTTGTNTIIIQVPAINHDKQIQYSGTSMLFDRIIYFYADSKIHRIVYADPSSTRYNTNGIDKILSTNVLELSFSYDPSAETATLVTATVRTGDRVNGKTKQITLTGKARLRNHI